MEKELPYISNLFNVIHNIIGYLRYYMQYDYKKIIENKISRVELQINWTVNYDICKVQQYFYL